MGEEGGRTTEEVEADLDGEGGGNALEGSLAMGLRDLDEADSGCLYINLE